MVAPWLPLDILLGAEDDGDGLVSASSPRSRTISFSLPTGAGGAALEVNGAAEDLFRALHQRTGSVDLAHGAFAELLNGQINVRRVAPAGEVAEVDAQRRAIARKGNLVVGVNSAVAELEEIRSSFACSASCALSSWRSTAPPRGIQKLHDAKVRAPPPP